MKPIPLSLQANIPRMPPTSSMRIPTLTDSRDTATEIYQNAAIIILLLAVFLCFIICVICVGCVSDLQLVSCCRESATQQTQSLHIRRLRLFSEPFYTHLLLQPHLLLYVSEDTSAANTDRRPSVLLQATQQRLSLPASRFPRASIVATFHKHSIESIEI